MWHTVGFGWWMMFPGVLLWGAIIALLAWGIHRATRRHGDEPFSRGQKTPLDYLKERYARGEITKQEYEEIRRDLQT